MKKKAYITLGFVIAAVLLWVLFRNTEWVEVGHALRAANLIWLGLAVALVFATFVTRIIRWGYIVRTAQHVSFRTMFSATQIGFLGNFLLPGRVGEVIRAVVLARLSGLAFSRCFAFVALDRVTDLFGLIVVMLITVSFFDPARATAAGVTGTIDPELVRVGAVSTGAIMVGIIAAFVLLYINKRLAFVIIEKTVGRVAPVKLTDKLKGMLGQFADGMHVFKSVGDMSRAIGWSLVTWTLGTLCYYAVLRAFGIEGPWYTSVMVMAFLAVAISVPSTPGFAGPFHAAIVAAILVAVPGTDYDVAMAAALVAHLINVLPVWLTGGICLYTENLGLRELRRESAHMEEDAAMT